MTAALRLTGRPSGRRSSYFVVLFLAVALLSLFGLVMVLSASAANALRFEGSSWYYFRQQLVWLGRRFVALHQSALAVDQQNRWSELRRELAAENIVLVETDSLKKADRTGINFSPEAIRELAIFRPTVESRLSDSDNQIPGRTSCFGLRSYLY